MKPFPKKLALFALLILLALAGPPTPALASDHGDAPNNAINRGVDLADGYMFLDPNDNSKVVMIMTFGGFIVPGENNNFGVFADAATTRYRFEIENTGDAASDQFIDVSFSAKVGGQPQTATIRLPNGTSFTAPSTQPSNTLDAAPATTITTDPVSGISFAAGMFDDPFFFDIPGFNRFISSVRAGAANPAVLQRGRDTFAGYNVLAIALNIPSALIKGSAGNVIGMSQALQQRAFQITTANGVNIGSGQFVNSDRQGLPAINVALIPFARKNEYNRSNPKEDAAGKFANDIVATLTALGTNSTNIGILAGLAVTRGDILRIDTSTANSGPGGGNNAGVGYPNGRRLADDVIDTTLFFVANQTTLGDGANGNDVAFRDTFPFLAQAQQPRMPGNIDDNTRN